MAGCQRQQIAWADAMEKGGSSLPQKKLATVSIKVLRLRIAIDLFQLGGGVVREWGEFWRCKRSSEQC